MRDALFQGYGGAGFTHSSGGGLLQPADFHGMAALLIKDRVKGSKRRQQKALRNLMLPVKGNVLVRETLTCLEQEIASSQPTMTSSSTHPGSDSDEDADESTTLLNPPEFTGAAVSMLPPGDGSEAIFEDVPIIGSTVSRAGHNETMRQAVSSAGNPTVESLTFTTLFPYGLGGEGNTPAGCTHSHYIHKTLGSVARHFARAQEVQRSSNIFEPVHPNWSSECYAWQFVWYHYQDNVRRSIFGNSTRRTVGGHIATKATEAVLNEHKSNVQQQWDVITEKVMAWP